MLDLFSQAMVLVEDFNLSAPGAPWGGQQTIWDAYRDLLLAEKGQYLEPLRCKRIRWLPPSETSAAVDPQDVKASSSTARAPPRSITSRRMPLWPAPTYDSTRFQSQQECWKPLEMPPKPLAKNRLQSDGEDLHRRRAEHPKPITRPVTPAIASPDLDPKEVSVANTCRAGSASPRYAPMRYGAAIMRRQHQATDDHAADSRSPSAKAWYSPTNVRRPQTADASPASARQSRPSTQKAQVKSFGRPEPGC